MPVWSQKAPFKGHGSPCRGSPALFSTGTTWFLQLRDQICVLDSAASLRQWEIFFFPLKQTNLPVSYWSNLIVATQPTHYIFAILRKAFPEQGVGSRAQFYFPLNWDTLEIRKAALSVTGKKPCGMLASPLWEITNWGTGGEDERRVLDWLPVTGQLWALTELNLVFSSSRHPERNSSPRTRSRIVLRNPHKTCRLSLAFMGPPMPSQCMAMALQDSALSLRVTTVFGPSLWLVRGANFHQILIVTKDLRRFKFWFGSVNDANDSCFIFLLVHKNDTSFFFYCFYLVGGAWRMDLWTTKKGEEEGKKREELPTKLLQEFTKKNVRTSSQKQPE